MFTIKTCFCYTIVCLIFLQYKSYFINYTGADMKKIVISAFILLIFLLFGTPAFADVITTDAHSYILMDAKTGQVLCEKNADDKLYPASTTKILTAVVALEKGDLNQMMVASKEAVKDIGPDGMNIFIGAGEILRMEDLLNAMLIQSANETANILAENLAPTRKDFIDMMNEKARELGATNTHFTNPNGMHDDEHYTTARDLSNIARYAMTIPKFREIVSKTSYNMAPTNMHKKWDELYTTNKFLYRTSDYFTKVTGIKSGFTSQAGFNLVSSAVNKDGMELIAVVLGEKDHTKSRVDNDSKKLLEYGFQNFCAQTLIDAGKAVSNVTVAGAAGTTNVDLVTKSEFACVLPLDSNLWNINFSDNIEPKIEAPVKKGDILGYRAYERNGTELGKVELVAASSVEKKTAEGASGSKSQLAENRQQKSSLLINIIKIVLIIILGLILLRIVLRFISRSIKARRRKNNIYDNKIKFK